MAATGPAKPAAGVAERVKDAPLAPESRALLTPQHTPPQYVEALVAAGMLEDAIRATAFLLARREAVWWAVRCVRGVPAAVADPKAVAALDASAKWAASPTDESRRAAFAAAQKADIGTPAGAVGAAVYFAEGSLSPPKQPVVPPAPHLCPLTLANAVLLAAVVSEPEKAAERRAAFVAIGGDVMAGKDKWPASAPPPARPPYPPPQRPR
jgi:hypothetical protein